MIKVARNLLLFVILTYSFTPTPLYAQEVSLDEEFERLKYEEIEKPEKPKGFKNNLLQINKEVSKEIDTAAEKIDKSVSPKSSGKIEKNKTQIYFVVGGDFNDHGDVESNFRFGAHLHLPRFEKYWSVKFANQDEKRERGQSSVTRRQRTRNTNDDVFVGLNFYRKWDRIDVTYKPQIAINEGVGLDHSVEAETKYEFGRFSFEPSLEFFANHDEGTGWSSLLKFTYMIATTLSFDQGNDARFLNLYSTFAVNHYIGFTANPTDRLRVSIHYFRSFQNNVRDYEIAAYGAYVATNYQIYKDVLSLEVKPYIVFEREDYFEQTNGAVVNLRMNF